MPGAADRARRATRPMMSDLDAGRRRVVLGVTGGIAAYKAVEVCRRLVDAGAHVVPVLTDDATRFVGEVTFSALASEPVQHEPVVRGRPHPAHPPRPARRSRRGGARPRPASSAPTPPGSPTACSPPPSLATRAPVVVCPAMHTEMWEHPAVQENLATLRRRGVHVVAPGDGRLAGGDVGAGRLAEPADIVAAVAAVLEPACPQATASGATSPGDGWW